MGRTTESIDLTGKLLIAMPGMGDPRFEKAVIFMCAYSGDGAMGLIVNKPMPELKFPELLRQLGVEGAGEAQSEIRVQFGGPVEHGRGFVLHSSDYAANPSTLTVGDFGMTATLDILEHIAKGRGPRRAFLALGYSGWGPGQLDGEIAQNGWLTADASADLVFSSENAGKWGRALKSLGVDPLTLSANAGRA